MPASYYIGISGMMGAGKSTLGRALARSLGWQYVSETRTVKAYLPDLFDDMPRLAFEAQLSFFCQKALLILNHLENGDSVLVDRTLYEDRDVFAKYFRDRNMISGRAFDTYMSLADYFFSVLPPPDFTIFCDCPANVCEARATARDQVRQKAYPPNHWLDIASLYREWSSSFQSCPMFRVDSAHHDFRSQYVVSGIANDIISIIQQGEMAGEQLEFEAVQVPRPSTALAYLHTLSAPTLDFRQKRRTTASPVDLRQTKPYAYIAAPFSSFATAHADSDEEMLFRDSRLHGQIAPGRFRNTLLSIGRAMNRMGLGVLIPHRDVNGWGKIQLTPSQVFSACSVHVSECELFVGLIGESAGAHYELGIAFALRKPCILVECNEIPTSFIGRGIESVAENALVLRCDTLEEVIIQLSSTRVKHFIQQHCFRLITQ